MNYVLKFFLTLFLLQGGLHLYGQLGTTACNFERITSSGGNPYYYTFDTQNDFEISWGQSSENWRWVEDGTAENIPGTFWGDGMDARPAIGSTSGGGAVAIGGDITGSLNIFELDFSNTDTVYLRFNQYYRRYSTTTAQIIVQNSTGDQQTFSFNDTIPSNVETSYRSQPILDISDIAGGDQFVSISFEFNGPGYFWIIDDIGFYDDYPCYETVPAHYGPILTELGYPYEVDEAGWPYVPGQMVIQFTDDVQQTDIDEIAAEVGLIFDGETPRKETCVCDSLELWFLGGDIIDPNTGQSTSGSSIGILERTMGANAKTKVQGADPNYYTAAQIEALAGVTPQPLTSTEMSSLNANPSQATDVRIAIIDTGVDFKHPDIRPYIKAKTGNCYGSDDILGRNFVQDHNNPQDDHSHGTHVAGIIAQSLTNAGALACDFHLIPYKTHDNHGISTLFDVTCATYQAITDDVSIINDSWGFYGTGSNILQNALNDAKAQNILIVSAAGNDSISLDNNLLYPACYTATNKLTVSSYEADGEGTPTTGSDFSNYSNIWVDVAAAGRDILSAVPDWYNSTTNPTVFYDATNKRAVKTGTSMATPSVTAGAAIAYCERPGEFTYAIQRILDCATDYSGLMPFVNGGLAFNSVLDVACLTPLEPEPLLTSDQLFNVYPNPAQEQVNVSSLTSMNSGRLQLYDATGKLLQTHTFDNWQEGEQRQLNLRELPAGLYLLQMQTPNKIQTLKLMKSNN